MTEKVLEQKKGGRSSIGRVTSNKGNKTIIVRVERKIKHPVYSKFVRHFSKMVAHDENNVCQMGDKVLIRESRPLSKTKNWILEEILEKAEQEAIQSID